MQKMFIILCLLFLFSNINAQKVVRFEDIIKTELDSIHQVYFNIHIEDCKELPIRFGKKGISYPVFVDKDKSFFYIDWIKDENRLDVITLSLDYLD